MTTILPIARIAGIEIRVHLSWALLVAFLTLTLAVELPVLHPEWSPALAWATAAIVAVLAFGSVAVHELAHAVVARNRHVPTDAVTLYIFGSTAGFEGDARNPGADAAIAAAGPLASLFLGLTSVGIWAATALALEPIPSAIALGSSLIGALNVVIALVNLVPGFPLDGGRLLRALVWRWTGSERRGTRAVISIGRTIGLIGVTAGLILALLVSSPEGLAVMLVGWLMTNSARLLDRQLAVQDLIAGIRVEDAMEREGLTVPAGLTLDTFAADAIEATPGAAVRVSGDGGSVAGLIGNTQLRRTARRRWPNLRARDLMASISDLPSLGPNDGLWTALDRLQRARLDAIPVFADDALVGLATRRAVAGAVREALERRAATRGVGSLRGLEGLAARLARSHDPRSNDREPRP